MSAAKRRRRTGPVKPWRVVTTRVPQPSGRVIEHLECGHMVATYDTNGPRRRKCEWCPPEPVK